MIYYDLTSCMDYIGRNPLGIVRVEMKFAEYALAHLGPDMVTFCYFDRPSGTIRNLAFPDAQWVLSQIGLPAEPPKPAVQEPTPGSASGSAAETVSQVPVLRFRTKVKRVLQALRDLLPRSVPPVPMPAAAPAPDIAEPEPPADPFTLDWTPEDVFVTVGLIWDYLPVGKIYAWKKKLGFKVVGMIYDLVPYQVPEFCAGVPPSFFSAITDLIWCADGILTISKQTSRDVESFIGEYHLPRPKLLEVAYLGMDVGVLREGFVPPREELDVTKLQPGKFILQVGTMEARKNHALSITVWRKLSKAPFPELMPLVVVGAQGWGVSDIMDTTRRDIRLVPKYFMHSGRVSDQTLLWLYANCFMTIYPSFYEGWGLPVSESLANGRFCLSGDNGALIEAGGGFAEALSPFDTVGWAERLKWLMQHPEEVHERNERIAREFHPQSWDHRSGEFFALIRKVEEVAK